MDNTWTGIRGCCCIVSHNQNYKTQNIDMANEKTGTTLTAAEKKAQKAEEMAKLEAKKKATAEAPKLESEKNAAKKDPFEALAEQYAKLYPDNDVFHITSDKQVFLTKDLNLAQLHQSSLKDGEEVKTIKIK